jgi:hypothetical protein
MPLFLGCQKELNFPGGASLPGINTTIATSITTSTATSGGLITGDGGTIISARGICYSSSAVNPTIADNLTFDGTGIGSFVSLLTGLSAGTTYYLRAYVTNNTGTAYGNQVSFTTAGIPGNAAALTTIVPTNITSLTATSGGNITSDGGYAITERGICYDTNAGPVIAGNKVRSGSGTGIFSCEMTGLMANTIYFVRAYAINNTGTFYGDQISFNTLTGSIPTVTTSPVFTVTSVSAIAGGNIIADNGSAITAKGVCYSVNFDPTIANGKVSGGYGPGIFECGLSGLKPGTIYYVRAYATNSAGTAYGNQISFLTKT